MGYLYSNRRVILILGVGLLVLLSALTYSVAMRTEYREEHAIYDAAEEIVREVNTWDHLRATNLTGEDYDYVVLDKRALEWFAEHPDEFLDHFDVGFHFRIIFDDLNVSEEESDPSRNLSSSYRFGARPTSSVEVVALEVHYILDMHITHLGEYYPLVRNVCIMRVEVWD